MRFLVSSTIFAMLMCTVALAQPMGMGMGGPGMEMGGGMGMGMGMGGGMIDMNPVWSPDGDYIAYSYTSSQSAGGSAVKAGILNVTQGASGKPTTLANLSPLAWTPDSSGLVCGLAASGGQSNPYSGVWLVNRDNTKDISLIVRATQPILAEYSPDGEKLLVIDQLSEKSHKILIGEAGKTPKVAYGTTSGEKLLQAGWTHTSEEFWVLVEVSAKADLQPGEQLPDGARRQSGGGMMGGGMMGPGMMGSGMMGGEGMMMGPGMMGGGMAAGPTEKTILYVVPLDGSDTEKIGEGIRACAWNPTKAQIAIRRKIQKEVEGRGGMMMGPGMMGSGMMGPGMMGGEGGMMGPGMMGSGMMGPGMMGGEGMMGGMGPQMKTVEYVAVRDPYEGEESEQPFAYPSVPMPTFVWSPDGEMLAGANGQYGQVLATAPPTGPIYEVAQDFDTAIKEPKVTSIAWSPDGSKIAYPSVSHEEQEDGSMMVVKGLAVRDVNSGAGVQLTSHKSSMGYGMGGMMGGGGMMGPGMMGSGMMGPGMMGGR